MIRFAYTKWSLTETTKTCPASLSLGCLINPGMCELEHAGPNFERKKTKVSLKTIRRPTSSDKVQSKQKKICEIVYHNIISLSSS